VLSVTAVLIGRGGIEYRTRRSRLDDALAASVEGSLSANLAGPLWDSSKDQALAVLQPEMSLQDVEAIVVRGADKSVFAGFGSVNYS